MMLLSSQLQGDLQGLQFRKPIADQKKGLQKLPQRAKSRQTQLPLHRLLPRRTHSTIPTPFPLRTSQEFPTRFPIYTYRAIPTRFRLRTHLIIPTPSLLRNQATIPTPFPSAPDPSFQLPSPSGPAPSSPISSPSGPAPPSPVPSHSGPAPSCPFPSFSEPAKLSPPAVPPVDVGENGDVVSIIESLTSLRNDLPPSSDEKLGNVEDIHTDPPTHHEVPNVEDIHTDSPNPNRLHRQMNSEPYPYNVRVAITQPLALLMSSSEHTGEESLLMMADVIRQFANVDVILMPIILHGQFHLLVLDKVKKEYIHYSSSVSLKYDQDAIHMQLNFGNTA
ncbi:SH3 domain-containing protein C23A1.17-like [Dioscorea cayenensis subsp. rotundata]|uniref:SH3 domain-containing protein C23A1.17-like n=1 Tax=Dioscorea cayennensis subsp. rotundata TaxID=55577 RepID=A0AB40AX56_DIOCR|nr:SH3 domain-containing protein C23A1.17-like [Dioscorea cayenensis subsp. rotundata]